MFSFLCVTPTHFGASEVIFNVLTSTVFQLKQKCEGCGWVISLKQERNETTRCLFLASCFYLACPSAMSLHDRRDGWGYSLPTLLDSVIDGKVVRERKREMKGTAFDPGILPIRKTRSTSQWQEPSNKSQLCPILFLSFRWHHSLARLLWNSQQSFFPKSEVPEIKIYSFSNGSVLPNI